jgi:primosomal protein N'
MKIVTVIPLAKGTFKENLTYFTSKEIENGNIVSVTLRNKKILGLVVDSSDVSGAKSDIKGMNFNLKKIVDVKAHSIWKNEFLESAFTTNKYFAGMASDTISSLIPSVFKEEYDKIMKLAVDNNKSGVVVKNIKEEKLLLQSPLEDRISFYKTMIRSSFAERKSIFIVFPSELDIENFEESLSKGIEDFTFVMHSGITNKKLVERFEKIVKCTHPILILGTAPFLSIPRSDIGTIVVEHENSNIYKMMTKPYIDLRIFAEIYASKINAKFVLSDTLLRFESINKKDSANWGVINNLSFRINFDGELKVLNKGEKFQVLQEESLEKIKHAVQNKKSVFIFSLRKGLATMTICKDCGQTLNCDKCMAPIVLYLSRDGKKRIFSCNRCKTQVSPETVCRGCGSWNLMPLGVGTDTVYEEAKKYFPKNKIYKIDREIAKTKVGAKKIIKEFEDNPGSILIGTEMAFFYMKERVELSVIASFDSLWGIPHFKIGERIIQIILSLMSKSKKEIIIQTKNDKDSAIRAVTSENLLSYVREELQDRKNLSYPPFKRFIKVTHTGTREEMQNAKEILNKIFQEYNPDIFSGFVAQSKNLYSTNMLIKMDIKSWSLPELTTGAKIDTNLLHKITSLPITFKTEVDPEDLL